MNINKKHRPAYDSSESSSDSDSDNEDLPPQNDNGNYPSLSLVDDGQSVLHIPSYQGKCVTEYIGLYMQGRIKLFWGPRLHMLRGPPSLWSPSVYVPPLLSIFHHSLPYKKTS